MFFVTLLKKLITLVFAANVNPKGPFQEKSPVLLLPGSHSIKSGSVISCQCQLQNEHGFLIEDQVPKTEKNAKSTSLMLSIFFVVGLLYIPSK